MRALAGSWKLASLVAPAGWGKTTVLAQWCAGHPTLWVTATAADRDPAQLLGSLLASGARLSPRFGARTLARFTARREFERDGGLLTAAFLHELAERTTPMLVVVDDAHELAGARTSLAWLAGLVERSPASVRFVLAARGESLWPAGRFTSLGERHLDRSVLAFDPHEVQRLLARERVPLAERRAIAERQAGWAAGLRAAARAVRAGGGGEAAWGTLAERELAPLTTPERRDLLLASALDDLDPDALAALLGEARARSLVRLVRRRGLFLDDAGAVPRFHPLFLDVLRDVAARELALGVRVRALQRAARAYARRGQPARALAALAASGAAGDAIRGFEREAARHESDGALAVLAHDWLQAGVPAGAAESPAVRQLAARADADAGRLADALAGSLAASESWLARGRTLEAARAFTLTLTLALQTGQLQQPIREGERMHARLARRDPIAAALMRARLGALRLHAGDPDAARRDLDAALRVLPARLALERAETEVHRATAEFTAGRWTEYLTRTRRALDQFRRSGYWARAHALLVNMAEAYIYLGEEAVARRNLDEAAALAPRSGLHARGVLLELSRARAFSEEGRLADAGRAFRSARAEAARASTGLFDAMLDVWEGVWCRRRGSAARAVRLLTRAAEAFERLESPAWRNVARLERALVTGLAGEPRAALAELANCARVSRHYRDAKEEARVHLFMARVQQHAGQPYRANLSRALRLLDRENYRVLLRKERDVADALLIAAAPGPAPSRRRSPAPPSHPAPVRVRLLGGFVAERAGAPANPARTAARQLVGLLALSHGRPQRREALIEALWPDSPPGAGRNRFDVALHDARRALDPAAGPRGPFEVLRSEAGLVWLDDGVERDLERFETLAEQAVREGTDASLARALASYAGPLLPEWPDAPWAEDARARVRSLAESLRLARARAAFTARAPAAALGFAEQVLAEDALQEEAVAWRLRSLVALGRRGEAARASAEFHARCRRELDSPPGPELVALERELGIVRRD
jgi:ATP/maltotriose-dependent transcriptional regulator MalT/DNA-binding SARP family transcriptional activator